MIRIFDYPSQAAARLLARLPGQTSADADAAVARILADVRARGDAALRDWSARFDGLAPEHFRVPDRVIAQATISLDPDLIAALTVAAGRVRAFHARQPLPSWTTTDLGGVLGQRLQPLDRVGVYVPGGTAPLPSSLLMAAVPARVAGVREIIVCTPPARGRSLPPDLILAAAHIAGVDAVYCLGGAQAIAALAGGTQSIPRVDKIVGPGNLYVTLAKKQLYGQVGLDGLAGPTETVVVADESANPAWVAADLLAQAEHDALATAILFTPSRPLARAVQHEVGRQLEERGRADVIAASLAGQGGIVLTRDLAEAIRLADEFAPEHLCLALADPEPWLPQLRRAGGVFIGERSFEVLGDYVAGPSHVMPTGGTARFASPLNLLDFVRLTSIIQLDDAACADLSPRAATLARAEGLDGHAAAAEARVEEGRKGGQQDRRQGGGEERWAGAGEGRRLEGRAAVRGLTSSSPILPHDVLARRLGRASEEIIKLDANENPYGPSPAARAAIANLQYLHIYPDPDSTALREALAAFTGLPAGRLLAGAGADELIDLLLRALIEPGDAVVNCPPSFGMYPFCTAVNAGRLVEAPRLLPADDEVAAGATTCGRPHGVDVEAVEAAVRAEPRTKVLFLCSPNNPDGSVISDDDLRRLLALPVLVVLDEAYVEFADSPGRIGRVQQYDNLAVLRTFSKWAGLAGLRVGYGAFPEWLLPELWKIKQPYNVNAAASAAAIASLEDAGYLRASVTRITAERERLFAALQTVPYLRPYPSQANFILCRVVGQDARELKQTLEAQGILVRHFDTPGLRDCIRISVGRPEHSDRLLAALFTTKGAKDHKEEQRNFAAPSRSL